MTPSSEIRTVQANYIRLQSNTLLEVLRILRKADTQLRMVLTDSPSDYQVWNLPQIKLQIAKVMREIGGEHAALLAERTAAVWETGQRLIDAPISASGTRIFLNALDTRQLLAMNEFLTDKIRDVNNRIVDKINTQLGFAMIGSQPISDTISQVGKILESERWRAKAIVRTELGRVYNIAAQKRLEQAGEFIPDMGKMWLKSKKAHPRENHSNSHRQVVNWNESFQIAGKHGVIHMKHPKDPSAPVGETINCGCTMIPYHQDWGMRVPE